MVAAAVETVGVKLNLTNRLKGVFPVSTGVVVTALARPEWLVEIDATAVLSTVPSTGAGA